MTSPVEAGMVVLFIVTQLFQQRLYLQVIMFFLHFSAPGYKGAFSNYTLLLYNSTNLSCKHVATQHLGCYVNV